MDISTLLSGAGQVSTGVRDREEALRRAREDQLRLEALNRQNRARQIETEATVPNAPDFGPLRPRQDVGVAPTAPAAAPAPAPAPAAGVKLKPAENPTTTVGKPTAAPAPTEPPPMTRAEFMALSPAERARRLQIINDQRRINQGAAGAYYALSPIYDIGAAPINAAAWAVEKGANAVGWPRLGRALGIYGPEVNEVTVPRIGDGSLAPMAGDELRRMQANAPLTEEQYLETLPASSGTQRRGGSAAARRKNAAGGLEVPGTTAPGSSQYDKPTQYDALIQQAAVQNGLDPVIFKRLLGTESSFNPKAVSPRGKSYGLGIAQIADVHGLSDEQRLDPNIAIPAGAQIFAKYLADAGGNYEEAMMKYKGAVSEKGRASMAPVIASILNGVSPVGTAQAGEMPQPVATLAATGPALQQVVAQGGGAVAVGAPATSQASPAQFYLSNPQAIGRDMRVAMQQRDELVRMAQMYQRSGMGNEYAQVRQAIMALDNQMANLNGIQAVQELEFANDPTRLSQMLSYVKGQQIDLKPYTNGTFDIYINGQLAHRNVPGEQIKDQALSLFDPQYVAQKAERATETHKANLKAQELLQGKYADLVRELLVAQQNGMNSAAVERLKKKDIEITPSGSGDGTVFIQTPDGLFTYNPAGGGTMKIDNVEIPLSGLKRIAGINVGG